MPRGTDAFEQLERDELVQWSVLKRGAGRRPTSPIAPGTCRWSPSGSAAARPRSAEDAIGLALAAERRAEAFYCDVAMHAQEVEVKSVAVMMASDERRHIERLEGLLGRKLGPVALGRRALSSTQHR